MANQKIIMVRRARAAPVLLLLAAGYAGITQSYWWFLSIPFIAVGWVCAAQNLNLANGMLAYLSMVGGFILLHFHRPLGAAIALGTMAAFYLCAIEMRVTAKPYIPETDNTEDKPNKASQRPVNATVRHREKTREINPLTDTGKCVKLCVEVDNGDKSST